MRRGLVAAAAALLLFTSSTSGQVDTDGRLLLHRGVDPATVTIGQPFRTAIRVDAPPGTRVEYGELTSGDSLQSIAPVTVGMAQGGRGEVAIYSLVAWITGTLPTATVTVRVTEADGTETLHLAELALPEVRSVLPEPGQPVEPRPLMGVVGRTPMDGIPWWWLAVILAAIIAAILAYRRLRRGEENEEAITPRDWALSQLSTIDAAGAMTVGEAEEAYRRTSWILRGYLARLDDRLGPELTTGEIDGALRDLGGEATTARSLRALLDAADRVKFAGRGAAATDVAAAVSATRDWIVTYPPAEEADDGMPRRVA